MLPIGFLIQETYPHLIRIFCMSLYSFLFDIQRNMTIFNESSTKKLQIIEALKSIKKKYSTRLERKNIQSTLQYRANNKKTLQKVDGKRGVFKLIEN